MNFLNFRISTIAGMIVLLLVCLTVGVLIRFQVSQFMEARIEALEALDIM